MPGLDAHQSNDFVKLMYIGDSGSRKTASLISLVEAGYQLRILDYDNGLDILKYLVRTKCPDKIKNVQFMSFRDKYVATPQGLTIQGAPRAYVAGLTALNKWEDGSRPAEWGPNVVCVVDSLTWMAKAAFEWARGMNPNAREPRTWYNVAQESLLTTIGLLFGDAFQANVIVISHIDWRTNAQGLRQGWPNAIGEKLGPKIASATNTLLLADKQGVAEKAKYVIRTVPTAEINLKLPVPFDSAPTYDNEVGLAEIFALIKQGGANRDTKTA